MDFTLSEPERQVLNNVHTVFYKARLIDSPELAQLGLQFTQIMQRLMAPKQELFPPKKEEGKGDGAK